MVSINRKLLEEAGSRGGWMRGGEDKGRRLLPPGESYSDDQIQRGMVLRPLVSGSPHTLPGY